MFWSKQKKIDRLMHQVAEQHHLICETMAALGRAEIELDRWQKAAEYHARDVRVLLGFQKPSDER